MTTKTKIIRTPRSSDMANQRRIYLCDQIRRRRDTIATLARNGLAVEVATELGAAVDALDEALRKLKL